MTSNKSDLSANFQIAILIEDIVEAKAISDGLREMGIFAHYYQQLDELWVSLNTYTPDLCIVDVKMMSQGTLLFKQHPKVKSNELKYSFYYKDSTKVLLNSTHGLNHYGLLRAEVDIVDQLRSVLRRRNEELKLLEQNQIMEKRVDRLKLRGLRLTEAQEKNHLVQSQHHQVKKLIAAFGSTKTPNEFLNRVIHFFNEWEDCEAFGIYHLNSTNQKMIAPKARKKKYKVLPDLWLSSENDHGISNYACEMAYDVCYGLISDDIMSLRVFGTEMNPDVLIIGQFNQKNLKFFEWDLLENKLNSEYRKSLINFYREEQKSSHQQDIFETFQLMDDIQYYQAETDYKFVLVDFSKLMSAVSTHLDNRFHWKSFAKEFIAEMTEALSGDFRVSNYGTDFFVVSLEKENIETEYHKLKEYVADFQVWRYFEDNTIMLASDIAGTIRFVAPAAVNVMRQAKDSFSYVMEGEDFIPAQTSQAKLIRPLEI